MLELFQEVFLPLFFKTEQKTKLVNKVSLYVIKEVVSYTEDQEGNLKREITRIESPKALIYEGKVTFDPNSIGEILRDPIHHPQKDPQSLEKAITYEHKDMVSSVYEMVNSTVESFNSSFQILFNTLNPFR